MALAFKHWLISKVQDPTKVPIPRVISGSGVASNLGPVAAKLGMKNPLIVSDSFLVNIGLVQRAVDGLAKAGLSSVVYGKVVPNPPRDQVVEGFNMYVDNDCDGLIAIGGGSPMDCCKIIGALVLHNVHNQGNKIPEDFIGLMKIAGSNKSLAAKYPPFVAIPTTAGTGSETTLAAVISFPKMQLKLNIADKCIIPKVAILDPEVIVSLPPHITAATGMDALTHAVESYLSRWQSAYTARYSLSAVRKIGTWLKVCYDEPTNLRAREQMLQASFEAGVAFTRANVGYVHAVAHTLGAYFGVPHGVGNSMVLPYVLDYYAETDIMDDRFCELALAIGLASDHPNAYNTKEGKRAMTLAFIAKVRAMNASMNIPSFVKGMTIQDVERVGARALLEGNGAGKTFSIMDFGYPCPKTMTRTDMDKILMSIVDPNLVARL
jgi:alcohol dehydrogenase class IV